MGLSVITWGLLVNFYGRGRKICYVPFTHLAARCYGRAYTGISTYSRCNDGGSRCVSCGKIVSALYYFVEDGYALNVVAWVGAFSALVRSDYCH